jgi:prevent-host-death family protein
MGAVGIRELKNRLTHYLRRVSRGEEVVVTQRGKPVALLHSIRAVRPSASLQARLAGVAAQGLIALPGRRPLRTVRRVKASGPPLSRVILEDRR